MPFDQGRGDGIAGIRDATHYSSYSEVLLCSLYTTLEVVHVCPLFPVCAPLYDRDTILVCGIRAGTASDTLSGIHQIAEISIPVGDRQFFCDWSYG